MSVWVWRISPRGGRSGGVLSAVLSLVRTRRAKGYFARDGVAMRYDCGFWYGAGHVLLLWQNARS